MDIITYDEFNEIIFNNKASLLCGNGFSINFDERYKWDNLVNSLYSTHINLPSHYSFNVISNDIYKAVLSNNFKNVMKIIKRMRTKQQFYSIFVDAVDFLHTILDNTEAMEWFEINANKNLTFDFSISELLNNIKEQSNCKNLDGVNYEYWTVLIYCVIAMQKAPAELYSLNSENIFVKLVLAGGQFTIGNNDLFSNTITNGMYTYFRLLFAGNILLKGDSFHVELLQNWDKIDHDKINDFTNNFNSLLTTNYDNILDKITGRQVYHLHGKYLKEPQRVLGMSLGMQYNAIRYDMSTITIGDYFVSKSFFQTTAKVASKNINNSKIQIYDDMIMQAVYMKKTNVVAIFGLNIDNDYHIIRSIQERIADLDDPKIIYCYFTESDRLSFEETYSKCITYSDTLNQAVKNISVLYVDSKEIIDKVFVTKR